LMEGAGRWEEVYLLLIAVVLFLRSLYADQIISHLPTPDLLPSLWRCVTMMKPKATSS